MCWLFQFLEKLQCLTVNIFFNCTFLCSSFDFRFERIWFKRHVTSNPITVYNGWCHNMAAILPNMDIGHPRFVKTGCVFAYSSIIISKIAKWAVFSNSRDLEHYFKNKLFLECSSPLICTNTSWLTWTKLWNFTFKITMEKFNQMLANCRNTGIAIYSVT